MTYRDLPETPGYRVALHCHACDEDFSATRGDYWAALDEEAICGHEDCGTPLILIKRIVAAVPLDEYDLVARAIAAAWETWSNETTSPTGRPEGAQ
jgi:hypothetical protein